MIAIRLQPVLGLGLFVSVLSWALVALVPTESSLYASTLTLGTMVGIVTIGEHNLTVRLFQLAIKTHIGSL